MSPAYDLLIPSLSLCFAFLRLFSDPSPTPLRPGVEEKAEKSPEKVETKDNKGISGAKADTKQVYIILSL